MLAFSNDYYGMIFRATQSVELFCAYSRSDRDSEKYGIKYVPYNKINMELILNETPAYVVEKVAECYL